MGALSFSVLWGLSVINLLGSDVEEFFRGRPGDLRGGGLVWRDQALLWALHVARVMSTLQVAVELFPGQQACKARSRLNKLRAMGLVERHRGGRSSGSETYLWTLTRKGFDKLATMMAPVYAVHEDDPRLWPLPEDAKHKPWLWAERQWGGSAIPARLAHDLAVIDFLVSYRHHVDAQLAGMSDGSFITTEWRTEHAFLPPLGKPDRYGERFPLTLINAGWEAFGDQRIVGGFDEDARLQVVKPDAALSIIIADPGEQHWVDLIEPPPWEEQHLFHRGSRQPHLLVDVLIELDRTGRVSDNVEKLRGLDMFLNLGRHLVRKTPVLCLQHSALHERYTAQVVVLFVCPPGRAKAMMKGADRILTGHICLAQNGGAREQTEVSYEARQRIVFCESDAFGDLTADLKDHERWLRLPVERRPPPPEPRPASHQMWLLPEMPPDQREDDEMIPRPWEHPAMVTPIQDPVELGAPDEPEEPWVELTEVPRVHTRDKDGLSTALGTELSATRVAKSRAKRCGRR